MIWTHVSELAVDRLLAGEVPAADAAAMRDHATSCADCRARLDDAFAVQRAFALDRPRLALPARDRKRPVAAALALAAGFALLATWPRHHDEPTVRTKGHAIVGFFVAHAGQVRRGGLREVVVPHDRVQLFTTTFAPAWFAAIGDDAAGTRSVYVGARPIEPGRERLLPLSIELDDTLGAETVTGVFCDHDFDPVRLDFAAPPPGCTLDRFTLVKVHP